MKKTCQECERQIPLVAFRWNLEWEVPEGEYAERCWQCRHQDQPKYKGRRERSKSDKATAYVRILRQDLCAYCNQTADTIDHIEPLKIGGTTHSGNLTSACRVCNQGKSESSLLSFLLGKEIDSVGPTPKTTGKLGQLEIEGEIRAFAVLFRMKGLEEPRSAKERYWFLLDKPFEFKVSQKASA